MTAYEKPRLDMAEVEGILNNHFGTKAVGVKPQEGGNLSSVFSFTCNGIEGIIKFSDLEGAYETERYVSNLLNNQGISYAKCLGEGKVGPLAYSIMERIHGSNLVEYTTEEKRAQLPELMDILTRMNHVTVGPTSGYGWIKPTGDGTYPTWKDYMIAVFAEDQTGNFWEGWYDLFRSTCLEKDVFEELYSRLMDFSAYNEPHRHLIHGDFHPWNILSDGRRITGIIDGNFAYGDFLVDLAILKVHMGEFDIIQAYLDHQEQAGITIPDFKERLIGAYYFKGMDGLRFYAKMGWKDAYYYNRDFLLNLTR
ncbi:phosphotransferase family protein [Paenibacillus mendelii]|uniref:Phosphotransferase family protein n=1 Tax=Paenibacillus mendelii TaxID=206163 RepID=A0ABV6JA24_9BACL|nr:aminoglycoside phosphotransferase family protein [Paenibacillus mendelii]MCQ6562069.1 aminoglycoside phosphotransferase family protein [Paenibacillus mendelii]